MARDADTRNSFPAEHPIVVDEAREESSNEQLRGTPSVQLKLLGWSPGGGSIAAQCNIRPGRVSVARDIHTRNSFLEEHLVVVDEARGESSTE